MTFIITAPPNQVEEGERIFRTHEPWMAKTHYRAGDKALVSYNVSKMAELSNPLDLNSKPTGNTCFVLTEVYEIAAGVADHFQQAQASWQEFTGSPDVGRGTVALGGGGVVPSSQFSIATNAVR